MRRIGLLLLGLVVAGCADQQLQLNRGLNGLIGLNIHHAVDVLGDPDGKREINGDTVYTWFTHQEVVLFDTTSTGTAAIGGSPVYGSTISAGTSVNGTTTTSGTVGRVDGTASATTPTAFQCTIEIAADKDGTIKRYQFEGNQGGCQRYARRFH